MTTSTPLRPPFAYAGGKALLATRIAAMLPRHTHYVEPFGGGMSVLLAKRPVRRETVNDVDADLMLLWRMLRDRTAELLPLCAATPHCPAERAAALDRPDDLPDLERARRVWVCLSQGRGGTLRTTGWRHDLGATHFPMEKRLAAYVARMEAVARRLRQVALESRPALEVIEAYGRHRNTLIYADPPYLGNSGRARLYRHEMLSASEHRELAQALHACRATVVLSGYPSELYDDELYGDWYRIELASATSQGGVRRERTEVLWSNRPLTACNETPDISTTGAAHCPVCDGVVRQPATGRPARFCSGACRVRAHRQARAS